jgi:hypothetical protein
MNNDRNIDRKINILTQEIMKLVKLESIYCLKINKYKIFS